MCEHHNPTQKLQRLGFYLAAALLVVASQYYLL